MKERTREPLPFPLTAYPPPLLDRERKKREREGEKEGEKERKEEMAREERNTHRRPRNCLRFCFTSRGYLSIAFIDFSHSCFLRCSAHDRGLHLYLHRQERERSCARKNAKWPEIFVCASLCNYSLRLL